ncbi:hypothetical protein NVP1028O_49 [Vibrio phage 1.028.O._10N.286.45.B6]|nr:hypothetical protein NVP1028O_49 [Vibrio phage 1.028.O._10N.286.45.B6]AUR90053.1 hypothetical protein NVP1136O_49 [Vibrio phage 1.136.O._10N.261.45.E11]AUR90371.1 hypothetical protein NVP1142O_49 [Vibrio phage 1.142.O._10N.261.49.E11]AUR91167.1 hypothetical protein NVP1156O_49 [Vibrio phage 1.156.O._10N.261.45.A6]AUR91348.1 hypothetical protein NVP1159O_49 [Vibrio phage 1.159.O._10N.261.46.F12]AUR96246.1 hypothetical protein NVP1217O_49 [Vibrio phage 1.217.O._10N.261.45.A1]AUR96296.1 hypot
MHYLNNGSQVESVPPLKPRVGTRGYFTESNDEGSPSYPGQDWFNAVIREFQTALSDNGISFDPDKYDHLSKMTIPLDVSIQTVPALIANAGSVTFIKRGFVVTAYLFTNTVANQSNGTSLCTIPSGFLPSPKYQAGTGVFEFAVPSSASSSSRCQLQSSQILAFDWSSTAIYRGSCSYITEE